MVGLLNIQNFDRLMTVQVNSPGIFLTYIKMDMNTTGIGTLVIGLYKGYGVVLFEGGVYYLFPETKTKPLEYYCSVASIIEY